jgi:hypothetical protein
MKYATFRYDTIEVENWLKGAIVFTNKFRNSCPSLWTRKQYYSNEVWQSLNSTFGCSGHLWVVEHVHNCLVPITVCRYDILRYYLMQIYCNIWIFTQRRDGKSIGTQKFFRVESSQKIFQRIFQHFEITLFTQLTTILLYLHCTH